MSSPGYSLDFGLSLDVFLPIDIPVPIPPPTPPPYSFASAGYGLPAQYNVGYTSVRTAGNVTLVLPILYTTPQKRIEAAPSYGVYKRWITTFKVDQTTWNEIWGSTIPKMRDTLVSGGLTWTVYAAVDSPAPLMPLWRLACDRLEIDLALDDPVTLVQATCAGSAADTSRTVTHTSDPSFTAIPAAIEPRTQAVAEIFGTLADPDYFDVYLQSDPSPAGAPSIIKVGDLFQDAHGVIYEILEVLKRERLDLLPQFTVVKKF